MSTRISLCPALCVFLVMSSCVAETEGEVSQVCSCAGDSAGGCDPSQRCSPYDNCDKENVAYGKPAQISSQYPDRDSGRTTPACAAVNGRTGHVMKLDNGTNCVHSAHGDRRAWWRVDLGRRYTITDLTIYSREKLVQRLGGIWIYVDNAICSKLPDNTVNYPLVATIPCDSPLRGQVVTLAKNGTTTMYTQFINFCELQIWVCKAGRYGGDCRQTCHCDNNRTCDNHYGTCHNEGVENSGAVSLAGPVTGAVFGGFCLGVISILIGVWLCRRREAKNRENPNSTPANPQIPGTEHRTVANISTTYNVTTNDDVTTNGDATEQERGEYDSLQRTSDYRSAYITPVFVYDNTNV